MPTETEILRKENERLREDLDKAYIYIGKQELSKMGIPSTAPKGEQKPDDAVYKGCNGCLTDDCDHWNNDTCKEWVPCIIGRNLTDIRNRIAIADAKEKAVPAEPAQPPSPLEPELLEAVREVWLFAEKCSVMLPVFSKQEKATEKFFALDRLMEVKR